MTVANTTAKSGPYTGNSVATSFTFSFKTYATTDLQVVKTVSGVESTLTIDVDYSVSLNADQDASPGGTVTYPISGSPLASPDKLTIVSNLSDLQLTDVTNLGGFFPQVVEDMSDVRTILSHQNKEALDRALKYPVSDSAAGATLPSVSSRASMTLAFDASGNPVAAAGFSTGVLASAFMQTVLDDTTAAAARTTLGALGSADVAAVYAPLASPALTGSPTAPTQVPSDNDTSIATTAMVQSAPKVPVRQTVLHGVEDSNGYANHLSAGAGLNFNIAATATPLVITYANGFGASGDVDTVTVISADASNQGSLSASNLNYITSTRVTDTSVTWGSTLAPWQQGYAYDKTKQSSLTLNNVSTDDFGNSWTNTGVTFSNTSPKYSGTFFGVFTATSTISSTNITSVGAGGWTIRFGFLSTSVGTSQTILESITAGGFGINISIVTSKINLFLSSTGSSWDIANAVVGNTTFSGSTWYDVELTYDPVAGKYFTYVNGVAEALLTITSSAKIAGNLTHKYGKSATGLIGNLTGTELLPYCKHPNGTTFTVQTALASVSAAGYASDFFSIPAMTMYGVTAASASAGTNPTLTAKNVVYHGEMTTNATVVVPSTGTVNYAYKGQYVSADTTIPGLGIRTQFSGNLGVIPLLPPAVYVRNLTADSGFTPGMIAQYKTQDAAGYISPFSATVEDRNTLSITTGATNTTAFTNRTTGVGVTGTAANWKFFILSQRGW
jgi:hypothetical protein